MKLTVQKLFEKDINKITDKKLSRQLSNIIEEMEKATTLANLRNIKKMLAKGHYYCIRIGNYRLGFKSENDSITLLRFMHRKDIYSYFP